MPALLTLNLPIILEGTGYFEGCLKRIQSIYAIAPDDRKFKKLKAELFEEINLIEQRFTPEIEDA